MAGMASGVTARRLTTIINPTMSFLITSLPPLR